jgi:carbon starvation protein
MHGLIGYGGMLLESMVAMLALIAACVLTPGIYFAINAPAAAIGPRRRARREAIRKWGSCCSRPS